MTRIPFERPGVTDFGSISAHTFMPTPPVSAPGRGGHKGYVNCRIETSNCELSHPGDPGGGSP